MDYKYFNNTGFCWQDFRLWQCSYRNPGNACYGASMFYGVSEPMIVKGIIENRIVNYKKIEEISQSLRNITDEFRMGRLEEARYHALKIDYENEIKKYS